ncbi:MAG: MBL fold metallo-hydrolase [Nitritalea sp.]
MLKIKKFTFNAFQENTYLVYDETGDTLIIDPGCYEKRERDQLADFIAQHKLQPKALLNTHCHIDHVLGNAWVMAQYKLGLAIHEAEVPVLKAVESYAANYGFPAFAPSSATEFLSPGTDVPIGNTRLEVLFVPGHAPGHVVFYHPETAQLIAGDTLFQGSIGRTDLPGGDHATLLRSIRQELFQLPDETIVYCGHGPETRIGVEKIHNPFVGERA